MAARDAIRRIDDSEDTADAEEEPRDYMQRVSRWEKDGRLQGAVDSFEERIGPIAKGIGDKDGRADIPGRLKWRRNAKRRKRIGLVSGEIRTSGKYARRPGEITSCWEIRTSLHRRLGHLPPRCTR